jgi:hypothetical protein
MVATCVFVFIGDTVLFTAKNFVLAHRTVAVISCMEAVTVLVSPCEVYIVTEF